MRLKIHCFYIVRLLFLWGSHSIARAHARSLTHSAAHSLARSLAGASASAASIFLSPAHPHSRNSFSLHAFIQHSIALNAYLSEFACVIFALLLLVCRYYGCFIFLYTRFWVSLIYWDIAHTHSLRTHHSVSHMPLPLLMYISMFCVLFCFVFS